MLDHRSPLDATLIPGRFGATSETPVTLGQRPLRDLWQLAGWSDFATAATPVLGTLDFAELGDYRAAQIVNGRTLWRVAPDKIWIEGVGASDLKAYAGDNLAVLDLSHSRTVLTINGAKARDLLAMMCSVDLSSDAFFPGDFVQSGMAQTAVLVQCVSETAFEVLVPITWAASLWDALCLTATPLGYVIEGHAA